MIDPKKLPAIQALLKGITQYFDEGAPKLQDAVVTIESDSVQKGFDDTGTRVTIEYAGPLEFRFVVPSGNKTIQDAIHAMNLELAKADQAEWANSQGGEA